MIGRGFYLNSPLLVLTITWLITISLYIINPFQLDLIRSYTWFIITIGLSTIYLGFLTAKLLGERFILKNYLSNYQDFPFPTYKVKKLVLFLSIISFLGVVFKMYLFVQEVPDINMFLVNAAEVRRIFIKVESGESGANLGLYKLFSHMASLNSINIILAGAISNIKKHKIISVLPLIVSAIYSVATLQRVYFIKFYVLWLACSFIFIYYFPSDMQKEAFRSFLKKALTFILVAVSFLFFVIILRSLFDFGIKTEMVVNSFYFYIAGNIYLLDKYLLFDHNLLYGTSLFRSFVGWFVGFGLLEKASLIAPHYEFYRIYNTLGNTFTFIRIPYEDFGVIGLLLVSYFWGWIAFYVMSKYLKKFSFFNLGFAAMILWSFFWSFYGFAWTHLTAIILMFFQLQIVDFFILNHNITARK